MREAPLTHREGDLAWRGAFAERARAPRMNEADAGRGRRPLRWLPHAPQRIRTSNLRFRRPMLYPVELRVLVGRILWFYEPIAKKFCKQMQKEGVLAKDTHDVTVRFAPPLVISDEQIDDAFDRIRRTLDWLQNN